MDGQTFTVTGVCPAGSHRAPGVTGEQAVNVMPSWCSAKPSSLWSVDKIPGLGSTNNVAG